MGEAQPAGSEAISLGIEALVEMQSALEKLDRCGAPADIGAHLDNAIARLDDWVNGPNSSA